VDVLERRFVLRRHKRKKYRCECGACIETAPLPPKLVDGGRYSIDFAIEVAIGKYLDHLPLERQVRIMRREGLVIDSQTLWDQIERLARVLRDAYQRVRGHVLSKLAIGADEIRWRLMGPTGKDEGEATRWQVWTACADDAVFYTIEDSRSADAAEKLFEHYAGCAICDGYSAYSVVIGRKNTTARARAEVAALFYSLVESAKLAGVDPKAYLRIAVLAALRAESRRYLTRSQRPPPCELARPR
jgi:transposase